MAIIFRTGFLEENLNKVWNNIISVCISVVGLIAIVLLPMIKWQEIVMNLVSAVGMSLTFWYICFQKTNKK